MRQAALGTIRPQRGSYGIDGGAIAIGALAAVLGTTAAETMWAWRRGRANLTLLSAAALGFSASIVAGYLYSSGPGKRSVWSELLEGLDLVGDEEILDVGCGRGAVLVLAARRVPRGRAVGVDVWRSRDQSGNSARAAARNARTEGVADRVELVDGDARSLPFPAASFDVVVSNLALHNIRDPFEREEALCEVVRVLRPGGRLVIADHGATRYAEVFRELGCADVAVSSLDWRTSFGIPGHRLDLVSGSKHPL